MNENEVETHTSKTAGDAEIERALDGVIDEEIKRLKDPDFVLTLPLMIQAAEESALDASLALPALLAKIDAEELDASIASSTGKNDFERKTQKEKILRENVVYQRTLMEKENLKVIQAR